MAVDTRFSAGKPVKENGPFAGMDFGGIREAFDHDPARILSALAESQRGDATPREIVIILPVTEVRNLIFPPFEAPIRWRFAYAKAEVSRSTARRISPGYFSSSQDRFADLASRFSLITSNEIALRQEIGPRSYDRLAPTVFAISKATRSEMALRNFVDRAYEAGDFQLRPARDWGQFLLDVLVQFYIAAEAETRIERYPWEAASPSDSPFFAEVRQKASSANHDPVTALREVLTPP
jgi:hypothetical protein